MSTTMRSERRVLAAVLRGLVATLASFGVALIAAITVVSRLSANDAITLGGGIAIFATVLSVWTAATGAGWWRWWSSRSER
jgi:hypothetical protein